jgi:hypothetical protein
MFSEMPGKVALVGKSGSGSDFCNGLTVAPQTFCRPTQSKIANVLGWARAINTAKLTVEMFRAHAGNIAKFRE